MPLNFTAPANGSTQEQPVTVSWDVIPDVDLHYIEIATDAEFTNIIWAGDVTTNSVQISGVAHDTQFFGRGKVWPGSAIGDFILLTLGNSTYPIGGYNWTQNGFGSILASPTSLPTGLGQGLDFDFTTAKDAIAIGVQYSPFVVATSWSSQGFGTKFANPSTYTPGYCHGVRFTNDNTHVGVCGANNPQISAYIWSSAGFGTKLASPPALTGTALELAFSPLDDAVVVQHLGEGLISAFAWSSAGFGTKFADPATLPGGWGRSIKFSPAGTEIALSSEGGPPLVSAYPWSGSGFGTKFANPTTAITDMAYGVEFNPLGDVLSVASAAHPRAHAYAFSSSGFGTKFANPATVIGISYTITTSTAFSSNGDALFYSANDTPFLHAYMWGASGYGTKYAAPAITQPSGGEMVRFIPR